MALLTGMTEDGREVPVQVDANGRLVAEGLQGPAGADGQDAQDLWTRTGTELSPKTAGDSVFTTGTVKVGGTSAIPNALIEPDGRVRTQLIRTAVTSNDPAISHVRIAPYDAAGTGNPVVHVGVDFKVGIGTSAPVATLDIKAHAATNPLIISGPTSELARVDTTGDLLLGGTLPASPNITLKADGNINAKGAVARVHADNAAAVAAGLVEGDFYRKPDGTLMVAF